MKSTETYDSLATKKSKPLFGVATVHCHRFKLIRTHHFLQINHTRKYTQDHDWARTRVQIWQFEIGQFDDQDFTALLITAFLTTFVNKTEDIKVTIVKFSKRERKREQP